MKATKIASIFALTAVSVVMSPTSLAFDIIKSDDLTINMNGDIDLTIEHDTDNDNRTEVETNFDDLDFDFKYKIDDSLTFIAASDWTIESNENETLENDQSWAGIQVGDFILRAGYQEDAIEPLGIDSFEIGELGRASADQDGKGTKFEESIFGSYEGDNYEVRATFVKASATNTTNGNDGETPERRALAGKVKVGNFLIEGGFGNENDLDEEVFVDFWQAQVEYFIDDITLGVLYGEMKVDFTDSSITDLKSSGYEFNVSYKVNKKLSVFAGYEQINNHTSGTEDFTQRGVGAVYKFSKLAKLYVEVASQRGTYLNGDSTDDVTDSFFKTEEQQSVAGMLLSLDF